jgi:hypothetical protein
MLHSLSELLQAQWSI